LAFDDIESLRQGIEILDETFRRYRLSINSSKTKTTIGQLINKRHGSRQPVQYLTDLDFADDLAITAESVPNAESLLQSLEKAASAVTSSVMRPRLNSSPPLPLLLL
jgi:hypothetical protein